MAKDSGFGRCILMELRQGDEEELLMGEATDLKGEEAEEGEAKSKDLAREVVNFSLPNLAHFGFQNHPTMTPTKNATHRGLKNIPTSVQNPNVAGFSNISYKDCGKGIRRKKKKKN